MSTSNNLVVADLHKAFGVTPVLTGLDLEVPAGCVTAILGASGSGKTTLLRVLAGFERPDRGTVTIGKVTVDDDHRHVPAEERRIGYVSQEGSLFPHLTVEANVGFGLPRRKRHGHKVHDLLDAVGLTGLGGRYPHELSGGQQQRVALARALAVRPRLVLLDEPFASLDANLKASVRADVQRILLDAGMTAVLVTHDQNEALSCADLAGVIREGKIVQLSSPRELYCHPLDADLASFVGEANLIEGLAKNEVVDTPLGMVGVESAPGAPSQGRVTVMIRPEQVEVRPSEDGSGIKGRVLSAEFYGHDAVVRIAPVPDGICPPLIARVLGTESPQPGSIVMVGVRGAVRVWPSEG